MKFLYHENLKSLREKLLSKSVIPDACSLLNLDNYSSVRNMCSIAGILNDSDLVIFIDDDEVFEDSNFISKAVEHMGRERDGEEILAVAGYYVSRDGGYRLDENSVPFWKRESWNGTRHLSGSASATRLGSAGKTNGTSSTRKTLTTAPSV